MDAKAPQNANRNATTLPESKNDLKARCDARLAKCNEERYPLDKCSVFGAESVRWLGGRNDMQERLLAQYGIRRRYSRSFVLSSGFRARNITRLARLVRS